MVIFTNAQRSNTHNDRNASTQSQNGRMRQYKLFECVTKVGTIKD